MDNFSCIYQILKTLESALDDEKLDMERISPQTLGISKRRQERYLEMMEEVGLIKGLSIKVYMDGSKIVKTDDLQITLKGLEYLTENTLMKKAYKLAKGIKDVIPVL